MILRLGSTVLKKKKRAFITGSDEGWLLVHDILGDFLADCFSLLFFPFASLSFDLSRPACFVYVLVYLLLCRQALI